MLVDQRLTIPDSEFEFSYARSGGPGGQNVNKVNSKAILRWSVELSPSISEPLRARLKTKYSSRLTEDGYFVVVSQRYRDQKMNVDDCLEKLAAMISTVINPPTPRRPTKPTKASKLKRIQTKQVVSGKKQSRQKPSLDY
jgi:ribosome-associated protein